MIYLKWWKERNYNQEYSTQQDSHSVLMEKSKAFQTSKSQENSANQTRFTTNAKGTSPGRKHKRRKRSTDNKSKTIKKKKNSNKIIHINNYLKYKWIKCTTKRQMWRWKHVQVYTSTYHSAWFPKLYVIILFS